MPTTQFSQGFHLKKIIEKSRYSIQEISENTEIARSSLYDYFKKKEVKKSELEKICSFLGVDIMEFYPDLVNFSSQEYNAALEKIKTLEQVVKDKDTIIASQQEIIDLLKHQQKKAKPLNYHT